MSIDALQAAIRKRKNPSMVGLDPTVSCLPPQLLAQAQAQYGDTLKAAAHAFEEFCNGILDALVDIVPAVKVQSCCFAALGSEGVAAMERLLVRAQELGYYVVLDAAYNSVGHISEVVAQAVFGGVQLGDAKVYPYPCDGITVNGYTGSDEIKPFLPYCQQEKKNIFLYIKTSNKSSREVQDLISGDRVIYTAMADLAMRWSTHLFGQNGYSEIAAVVGATYPDVLRLLREKYDRLFFLVPGFGAQGGNAKNVQYAFDRFGHGAVICASRSIIAAWQKSGDAADFAQAARRAAEKMRKDILSYVTVL